MPESKKPFLRLYLRTGDRGVCFGIFFIAAFIHIMLSLNMEMISIDPNEFSVAANSALFLGHDWSGITAQTDFYAGYVTSVLYTPVMLIFEDPFAQYTAMLIVNSLLISLVPVIAYRIAYKSGVERLWQRLAICVCCGFYSTYIAHTKFIWNETLSILVPWLLILIVLKTYSCKNRVLKHFMSGLCGFMTVLALGVSSRLVPAIISLVIVIIIVRCTYKKKIVFLPMFIASVIIFSVINAYISVSIQLELGYTDSTLQNSLSQFISVISGISLPDLLASIFGQLFYFVTSTWGLGAVVLYLLCRVSFDFIKCGIKKKNCEYGEVLGCTSIYALLLIIFTLASGILFKFSTGDFGLYQDTILFGRFLDSVAPIGIMVALICFFTHKIKLTDLLASVVILGTIDALFFVYSDSTLVSVNAGRISPVLALYPLRVGEVLNGIITQDSLLITASISFCVLALLIVICCCGGKTKRIVYGAIMTAITIYSSVYASATYLPLCISESEAKNNSVYEVCEYVYNQSEAPIITAYGISRHTAALLQFLNQKTMVQYALDGTVTENTIVVINRSEYSKFMCNIELPTKDIQILGVTPGYMIIAYGENAIAYAKSQEGI